MADISFLRELSAEFMDLELPVDEDEVQDAYRKKASQWHPDANDEPDATDRFKTLQIAKDILLDDIDWSNESKRGLIQERFEQFFPDEDIGEISQVASSARGFSSDTGKRTDPEDFDVDDFIGATGEERKEMQKELMLGVEAMLVYQATEGLFMPGYSRADYYSDVNEYMTDMQADQVGFDDYYLAVESGLRDDISREIFIDSIRTVQENLQEKYVEGADIREIAMAISHFMAQGGISMGFRDRFIRDDRFGRSSRFDRNSRFSRGSRFDRGNRFDRGDRFDR